MRRFLISVVAMAVLLWAVDRAVGGYLARLYRDSASDDGDLLGRGFAHRPEVAVCGDSRAQNHYVSDSLETWLGARFFNFGRGGMPTLFVYGVAEMCLQKARPKVFILEGELNFFAYPDNMARLSSLLPYADEYPVAAQLADLRSRYEPLKRWSRIYPYNSMVASLLGARLGRPPVNRLGYVPLKGQASPKDLVIPAALDTATGYATPDPVKREYSERMVHDLRAAGVQVVAVRSPNYLGSAHSVAYDARSGQCLAEYFGRLGVPFIDMSSRTAPVFHDARLYVDPAHMNERGALLFSRALADSLKARRIL